METARDRRRLHYGYCGHPRRRRVGTANLPSHAEHGPKRGIVVTDRAFGGAGMRKATRWNEPKSLGGRYDNHL